MADKKRWTMLVYMAGDNDLDPYAVGDVKELLKVGTGPDITVVVQIDRSRRAHTRRHVIPEKSGTSYEAALEAAEVLPEINTGDPKVLADFVSWGRTHFPSDRLALVIWNHGWGWTPYDLEDAGRAAPTGPALPDARIVSLEVPARGTFRSLLPFRHSLFRHPQPVREALHIIHYVGSDTNTGLPRTDALDAHELARALTSGLGDHGPLDLLGFDACLMAGLEIAYELRDHARVLVGSEEDEPGEGWPYQAVLKALRDSPEMGPEKLGPAIAKAFVGWAAAIEAREERDSAYTQSAIRMSALEDLASATARLGEVLAGTVAKETLALTAIVQSVQRMPGDHQYADLGHFAKLVARHLKSKKAQAAAAKLIDSLQRGVLYRGHFGAAVDRVTGLTVYIPTDRFHLRKYRRSYSSLSFAQNHPEWLLFLDALHASENALPE
jgi:hypothetical protein